MLKAFEGVLFKARVNMWPLGIHSLGAKGIPVGCYNLGSRWWL
jgi:hypothetical protein